MSDPKSNTLSSSESVPIIDITPFTTGGTQESQKQVAQLLAQKASQNGCVGISGHNVPNHILSEAFAMTKKLFDLPYECKMKAPHPDGPTPHRGYSGTGRENAARKTETEDWEGKAKAADYIESTDYKESYEIGSDENTIDYNIWLPDDVFPGFREWGLKLYWELNKAARAILEALMMSLELEEAEMERVRGLHSGYDNQLRLLHYPPVGEERLRSGNKNRLGAHTDWRWEN
jgi:isopenicillin N synthase-like dioxygenase